MTIDWVNYQDKLWAYFSACGGVPRDYGMIAAQGWYLACEKEFRQLLSASGIKVQEATSPSKAAGKFRW